MEKQGENSIITYYDDYILKEILEGNDIPAKVEALREAYMMSAAKLYYDYIPEVYSIEGSIIKMQRIIGNDLGDYIKLYPTKDVIREIFNKVSNVILSILQSGIYHRDITYPNIIIDNNNKMWILDFGIADFISIKRTKMDKYYQKSMENFIDTLTEFLNKNGLNNLVEYIDTIKY